MNDIREQLVADVDEDRFSDMCAQTLVYGLLGSRVSDPDGFGATPVLSVVPLGNPFLFLSLRTDSRGGRRARSRR